MKDINTFTIIGRLVRTPEKRITTNGKSICRFDVASGRDKDTTDFLQAIAYDQIANYLSEKCYKGDRIGIAGRIIQNMFQTKEGRKVSETLLLVNELYIIKKTERPTQEKPSNQENNFGYDEAELPF